MTEPKKKRLTFIREASEILGVKPITLRRWWKRKILPEPSLINGRLCWRTEVIEQFIKTI
jgi:predicted site-specific integrase-resolvase